MADRARLVGINHVVLEVGDLDEALEFYGRLFEFELRGRAHGMAFLDMGDQFLVLAEGRSQPPDGARHFGLVVDDATLLGDRDFHDPWGNHVQVVQYSEIQFSKTDAVLAGMGLERLEKSESALRELRDEGPGLRRRLRVRPSRTLAHYRKPPPGAVLLALLRRVDEPEGDADEDQQCHDDDHRGAAPDAAARDRNGRRDDARAGCDQDPRLWHGSSIAGSDERAMSPSGGGLRLP